jgi:hypothetical protein
MCDLLLRMEGECSRSKDQKSEMGIDSQWAAFRNLQSELFPRFTRDSIEKLKVRRLTLAPFLNETDLSAATQTRKVMEKHQEGDAHQFVQKSSGEDSQFVQHSRGEDPPIGAVELMNLVLACAWGDLPPSDPRERKSTVMGRRDNDKAGPRPGPSSGKKNVGQWVWIRKEHFYEQGLGFVVSFEEVKRFGATMRRIVRTSPHKVDSRSFAEVVKESTMNRSQGKLIEGARENLHQEGDYRRAQWQEGDNPNQPFQGAGGNQRFYGNQQGRGGGRGGFNRNVDQGEQFRGGCLLVVLEMLGEIQKRSRR